ncbi:TPA: hypothetical protein JLL89_003960 [Escherichia coli]|uniref:ParB/RepB/Spo0J family partition protein n=1 Tax=Escherichia coli TaxID=562 RepID=UPI000DD49855|nr:KorB domain-containing protein [Escherichia coli]EGF2700154.1 hypothetical protein [Shigella sonnei]EFH6220721.1 hypothetical protein [Escherichia coli]EGE5904286.1 hypothetical protein [Escherichia coli]EJO4645378.1 hypothetical protein [Escherichia coli]EJR7528760.1 hypothetical protein [Escherichia coli]
MSFKKNNIAGSLSSISQVAQQNSANNAGQLLYVHPDDCYTDALNPRTSFDPVLVASYVRDFLNPEEGQHEPCHVYPKDERGYRIQHGATRHEAAKQAVKINPDFRLKVIVDRKLATQPEYINYWQRGKNNIQRDNMPILDRVNFIANYIEMAKESGVIVSQQEVADGLGLKGGNTTVSRLLALRDASPEIKEIIKTGRTEDLETLVNLVKIQQSQPELFKELVENTELDRATVRRAKKTGFITKPGVTPGELTHDNTIAHAQNESSLVESVDEDVVIIAYVDYPFETGCVNLLVKKTDKGFLGMLETLFEHGVTSRKTFEDSPLFGSEDEAATYAKSLLVDWSEDVIAKDSAISTEEYQDIKGFHQWLNRKEESDEKRVAANKKEHKKSPKGMLKATILGEVNGEKCELLVNVSQDVIGADIGDKETSGFVWVSVNGVIKLANAEDFVYKTVVYKG